MYICKHCHLIFVLLIFLGNVDRNNISSSMIIVSCNSEDNHGKIQTHIHEIINPGPQNKS